MIKDIDILNEVKARLTGKTDALSIHKYRVTPINGEDGIFINIVPGQRDYDKDNSKAAYTVTIPVTIIILVDGAEEDDASTLNEGVITQLDTIEEQVKNALEYYGAQWGFADVKDLSKTRVRTDRENRAQNRNFAARYITYELKVKEKIADRQPPSLVPVAGVLSVGAYDETTVALSWTFATDDTRREELLYQVYYSTADNISTVSQCETNGSTFGVYENKLSEVVTGLTAGTQYYFNVVVKDGGGNKTVYSRVEQTTKQIVPDMLNWSDSGQTIQYIPAGGGAPLPLPLLGYAAVYELPDNSGAYIYGGFLPGWVAVDTIYYVDASNPYLWQEKTNKLPNPETEGVIVEEGGKLYWIGTGGDSVYEINPADPSIVTLLGSGVDSTAMSFFHQGTIRAIGGFPSGLNKVKITLSPFGITSEGAISHYINLSARFDTGTDIIIAGGYEDSLTQTARVLKVTRNIDGTVSDTSIIGALPSPREEGRFVDVGDGNVYLIGTTGAPGAYASKSDFTTWSDIAGLPLVEYGIAVRLDNKYYLTRGNLSGSVYVSGEKTI